MPKKYLIFLGIIGLIFYYPLLFPGYIFSLDQAFSYYYEWPKFGANNYWIHILGNIFQFFNIPLVLIEKLVYIGLISSIGYFGYLIFARFQSHVATTFGILFLFANPFFYARFIEGQVNIYVSYALFIIFLYYFIEYFFSQKFQYWKQLVLIILLLGLTSLHNVFLLALPLGIGYISLVLSAKNKTYILKKLGFLSLILLIVNSLWGIPTMMRDDLGSLVSSFGEYHQSAFQSGGGDYNNIYLNHLALKGYWGEAENRFYLSELTVPIDPVFLGIILVLVFFGVYTGIRNSKYRYVSISLITVAITAYILSFGNSGGNIFSGFNNFLFSNVPYYVGFREPHKWIMLVTFAYGVFASIGIAKGDHYLRQRFGKNICLNIMAIFIILLPIFYTPALLFGYAGQIQTVNYPQQWKELRSNIPSTDIKNCTSLEQGKSTGCYHTLVFPWHGYINIGWTETPIVLGSIFKYFGSGVLFGDTIEIRNIYTQSTRPESAIIEQYAPKIGVNSKDFDTTQANNFITDMSDLGIEYIILVKESDYTSYQVLFEALLGLNYIEIVHENEYGTVYKI